MTEQDGTKFDCLECGCQSFIGVKANQCYIHHRYIPPPDDRSKEPVDHFICLNGHVVKHDNGQTVTTYDELDELFGNNYLLSVEGVIEVIADRYYNLTNEELVEIYERNFPAEVLTIAGDKFRRESRDAKILANSFGDCKCNCHDEETREAMEMKPCKDCGECSDNIIKEIKWMHKKELELLQRGLLLDIEQAVANIEKEMKSGFNCDRNIGMIQRALIPLIRTIKGMTSN